MVRLTWLPLIALTVALSACAGSKHALRTVDADAPIWRLNPDKWASTENDLVDPARPSRPDRPVLAPAERRAMPELIPPGHRESPEGRVVHTGDVR